MMDDLFGSWLTVTHGAGLGLGQIVLGMLVPFLLTFPISMVYRLTQKSQNFSVGFVHALFLFASLSSVVTMLIGNNIARAFGLVGALSVIRFRNALKSPIDAIYIFWALALGMAAGTGSFLPAVGLVAMGCLFVLALHVTQYGVVRQQESILRIFVPLEAGPDVEGQVEAVLKADRWKFRQMNVVMHSDQQQKALVYHLLGKGKRDVTATYRKVHAVSQVQQVHIANTAPTIFAA
jgi:uncharacterized membrane protein YhiD involved in acid resistance